MLTLAKYDSNPDQDLPLGVSAENPRLKLGCAKAPKSFPPRPAPGLTIHKQASNNTAVDPDQCLARFASHASALMMTQC
jgi:hypothetical protein